MSAKSTISGKDLKAKLLAGGHSIKDVAEAMGVTPQNLYAYFKSSAIQRATLERIAAAIGEKPDWFTGGKAVAAVPLNGKQLKEKLKKAGIPVSEVANAMGVTTQSLYAIFQSKRLRVSTIETLSRATGKPRQWFYTYELPENEENKDELIALQRETIAQQKKYIALLEEKLARYEK